MKENRPARHVLRWISYVIVGVAALYFLRELHRRTADIPPIAWGPQAITALLFGILAVAATALLIGAIWHLLLRDQAQPLPLSKAIQIVAISQIGKYLPGNVGHFAGRAVLAREAGVPIGITASTLLIETAWTLAIGAGFSAMAFVFYLDNATNSQLGSLGVLEFAGASLFLLALPWAGIQLVNRLAPRISRRLGGGQLVLPPKGITALIVSVLMVICFLLLGASLKLQAEWFFQLQEVPWLPLTCLFTAAWLVGYVVPGAPGGLGVREAMMVVLLSPLVGPGVAVGLGVSMRLVSVAGDGLAFLIGVLSRHWPRHPSGDHDATQ